MAQATRKSTRRAATRRGKASARRRTSRSGRPRPPAAGLGDIPRAVVGRSDDAIPVLTLSLSKPPLANDASLGEEQIIGSTKFQSGPTLPRVFEEERFIFPESYGVDRVRLLAKDPEWLFAYWDLSPVTYDAINADLGQRAAQLARLTLKVSDASSGGDQLILVPGHARAWYVRVDAGRRVYRAELGFTLPSGDFRKVARSNTILTPWLGPSNEAAHRVARYNEPFVGAPSGPAGLRGRWQTEPQVDGPLADAKHTRERGGASDRYRR
jgi:hypothetical protein